jgi:carboxymethylenebutenolidase
VRSIEKAISFCLFLLFLSATSQAATAADVRGRTMTLPTPDGPVSVEFYAAPGDNRRPAVIILHGQHGLVPFHGHCRHCAVVFAQAGIDAYVVEYYRGDDARRANDPDAKRQKEFVASRVRDWSHLISAVASDILAGKRASDKIGLLGFSQGGFLATAVAGQDRRIAALGVFYGGIPNAVRDDITHLPPLLALHGDADRRVPLAKGKALVDLAKGLGQPAEIVVYPGASHGFAGSDSADAERRILAFFRQRLF